MRRLQEGCVGTDIRCRQDIAMAGTGTAKSDLTCKSNPASNLLMYVIAVFQRNPLR